MAKDTLLASQGITITNLRGEIVVWRNVSDVKDGIISGQAITITDLTGKYDSAKKGRSWLLATIGVLAAIVILK